MLAAFAALALSLPADPNTFTVEFRVLRVPAGCGRVRLKDGPNSHQMVPLTLSGKTYRVLPTDGSGAVTIDLDGSNEERFRWSLGALPPWTNTAELAGPKLRVGRAIVTATMTRPEWTVHTENREPLVHSAWQRVRIDTREVLTESVTFSASAVPTNGGRIEVRVWYTETELPPVKKSWPPLAPELAPFYADAQPPQSLIPPFRSPGVVKGTELAVLRPGESLMFSAGRRTVRPAKNPLCSRFDDVSRRYETAEEDVIVIATVRE